MSMSTPINQIRNQNQQALNQPSNQPIESLVPPVYNPNIEPQIPVQNLPTIQEPNASNESHNQLVSEILHEMQDIPSNENPADMNVANFSYATDPVNMPPERNVNSVNNLKAENTVVVDGQDENIINENKALGSIKNLDILNAMDENNNKKDKESTITKLTKLTKPALVVFIVVFILSLHQVNRLIFSFFPKLLKDNGQLSLYAILLRSVLGSVLFLVIEGLI